MSKKISEAINWAIREYAFDRLLTGNVTRVEGVQNCTFEKGAVEVTVKTHRAASGYDDCCGTEWPDEEAMKAARSMASDYNVCVRFSECEKGWGSFIFFDDGSPGEPPISKADGNVPVAAPWS